MAIVHFINEGIDLEISAGETLLNAQIRAGLQPNAPCGGAGQCKKCLVEVRFSGDAVWQRVLACQTKPGTDVELRTICSERGAQVLTEGAASADDFDPVIGIRSITVSPCARGESTADWDRLCIALDAAFGRRTWQINLPLASELGESVRDNDGHLTAVVCGDRVLDAHPGTRRHAMLAYDIGTTSVAAYLIDADDGSIPARTGRLNPQRQFGADVIARANHALSGGMADLTTAIRTAMDEMAEQLCREAGLTRDDVYAACAVGNSCMHHLLLGISPASLVRAPYNPAVSSALVSDAAALGLHLHDNAPLLTLPVIAGFVGADTVACLLAGHWENISELTLLIDIGTNGEIVLGDSKRRMACSTAAGPAFEGAKISCGMRGATGAVDRVRVENGKIRWHVIGDGEPVGICGSGLVDLVAALMTIGEIDESGRLQRGNEYRLGGSSVVLTQKDIREVQLGKAAICAGIRLMAKKLSIALGDIARVTIAGAFGSSMNPESALTIGLLPGELRNVPIVAVGNAAGEGACMALRSRSAWQRSSTLAQETEFLELATMPDFQDEFVDALEFGDEDE